MPPRPTKKRLGKKHRQATTRPKKAGAAPRRKPTTGAFVASVSNASPKGRKKIASDKRKAEAKASAQPRARPFIAKIFRDPLSGSQDHHHLPPFHGGLDLDLGDAEGLGANPLQKPVADVLMRHLTTPEAQGDFNLVALLEEAADRFHLGVVVVLIDTGAQLDFLDFNDLLLFARLGRLLLFKKAEFPVIENFADRRLRGRNDLDEIQPGLIGGLLRILSLHDAPVVTFGVDELDFASANFSIDTGPVLLRGLNTFHGTANGRVSSCK